MTTSGAEGRSGPAPGVYRVDTEASAVRFETRAMFGLLPVQGSFAIDRGEITVAEPGAASTVEAVIRADSFDSGHAKRDAHVRSADYLDATEYPEIHYRGETTQRFGEEITLQGELTVHGVTQPTVLKLGSLTGGDDSITAHAATTIDRFDFGLTNGKGTTGRSLTLAVQVIAKR